ncbi:hypothetical protein CRV24_001550 [Beauveria bassiana]|nr:hypothetical protein CRV24_001550 [Beauveria bassiana]KAH8719842.1 hypothetical protein HC256_000260 [Beauveria bassiana]
MQTDAASEPLSSHGDNHEPGGLAELTQHTATWGARQNDSASIDGGGKTAGEGEAGCCSDSSRDSDGGNDGDNDYDDDDRSSSGTDGEDGGCSENMR